MVVGCCDHCSRVSGLVTYHMPYAGFVATVRGFALDTTTPSTVKECGRLLNASVLLTIPSVSSGWKVTKRVLKSFRCTLCGADRQRRVGITHRPMTVPLLMNTSWGGRFSMLMSPFTLKVCGSFTPCSRVVAFTRTDRSRRTVRGSQTEQHQGVRRQKTMSPLWSVCTQCHRAVGLCFP